MNLSVETTQPLTPSAKNPQLATYVEAVEAARNNKQFDEIAACTPAEFGLSQ